jgi:hypothetical protein
MMRRIAMKSPFRRTFFLTFVLTSSISFAAAMLVSGCSHRSFAFAFHSHESVEGASQNAKSVDGPIVDKTIPAVGVKKVVLGVDVGSARVTGSGSDGIKIHAVRKYSGNPDEATRKLIAETRLDINVKGDTVELKDFVPEKLKHGNRVKNLRLDVELSIPAGLSVESGIGVGGMALDGRFASVKIGSGVGEIKVQGETGSLEIGGGVGAVHITDLKCTGDKLAVHNGTGAIEVGLTHIPSAELKAETGVGKVSVSVPSDARANAKLNTGIGACRSDFPLNSPKRGIGQVGGSMDGQINGGGASIDLHTGVGEVSLKKR